MLTKEEGKIVSRLGILWVNSKESPYGEENEEIRKKLAENDLLLFDIESKGVGEPIYEMGGTEYKGKEEIEQVIDWLKKMKV